MNVPPGLKRILVPLWNGGHRLAWAIREYGGAILRGRVERCSVCGRVGAMLRRPRAIPPRLRELWGLSPREAEALVRKETLDCSRCGAKLRGRRLAEVLLRLYPAASRPRSAREWAETPEARALEVAEINRIDGLHEALAPLPLFVWSDFGEAGRSEDLTRLSYPDESFDLVLTSETLEHVPDLGLALGEIHRVLRPGGRHLFTIPRLPNVPKTFPRARLLPDGRIEHLAPAICHPGGDVGYPVFTEFGADLTEILRRAGFEVAVHFGPTTEDDLGQVYEARKRPE